MLTGWPTEPTQKWPDPYWLSDAAVAAHVAADVVVAQFARSVSASALGESGSAVYTVVSRDASAARAMESDESSMSPTTGTEPR